MITIALVFAPHAYQANAFELLAVVEHDARPWPAFQVESFQGSEHMQLRFNPGS